MSFFTAINNYYHLIGCGTRYIRDAKHLTFEEAHPRRAACANEMLESVGVTYEIENAEGLRADRPCIYVANHTAMIDSVVMCAILPWDVRFLAKKELFQMPLMRRILLLEKHIPVYRGEKAKAHLADLKDAVAKAISEGASCLFFPEGTRTPDGKLTKFKLGAFFNAVQNNVPIVPVAIEGMFKINPKDRFSITPGHAIVHVLDPIAPPEGNDERERALKLAELAHDAIETKIKTFQTN